MVRLSTGSRTDDGPEPLRMAWDGTAARAQQIAEWSRDSATNFRFAYREGIDQPGHARTLVQRAFPHSQEWVLTLPGAVIERAGDDKDDPLRVIPPVDPTEVFKAPPTGEDT